MRTFWYLVGVVFLTAQVAGAQTKLSGGGQCAKPDTVHKMNVGDRRAVPASRAEPSTRRWAGTLEVGWRVPFR
jgi:hypothetical protein